jgi:radical SAM protein with 4Fe4S-binding SPASM domain
VPVLAFGKFRCESNAHAISDAGCDYAFFRKCFEKLPEKTYKHLTESMRICLNGNTRQGQILCFGQKSGIVIDANGDVKPCPLFKDIRIGNYLEHPDLAVLLRSNESYLRFHSLVLDNIEECRSCRFSMFCSICPGMNWMENRSVNRPNRQLCDIAKALYDTKFSSAN